MRGGKVTVVVRAGVSLALLGALVWWIGPAELATVVREMRWGWFFLAVVIDALSVLVGALNLYVLTVALRPAAAPTRVLVAYLRAWAVGMVAPGKLGDLSYAHFLSVEEHRAETPATLAPGLAVAVVDKIVTFAVTATIAVAGLAVYASTSDAALGAAFAALALVAALAALSSARVRALVRERLMGRYARRFEGFSADVRTLLRDSPGLLTANLVITIGRTLVQGTSMLLYFSAVGQTVSLLDVVIVQAVTVIVSLVPVTFAGLGVRQGASVVLYGRIAGIAAAPVLAHGLITTVTGYAFVAAVFAALGSGPRRRP